MEENILILLNTQSCLYCNDLEKHNEEITNIFEKIYTFEDYNCVLLCKYQDPAHQNLEQRIESCKFSEILDFISTRDLKNGIDVMADKDYLILILYGQGYRINDSNYLITEAIRIMPFNKNRSFINILPILNNNAPKLVDE